MVSIGGIQRHTRHIPSVSCCIKLHDSIGKFFHENWSMIPKGSPVPVWCFTLSIKLGSQLGFQTGSGLISDINDYQCMPSHWMKMRVVIAAWQVCRGANKKNKTGNPLGHCPAPPPRLVLPTNLDLVHSKAGGPCGPPTQISLVLKKRHFWNGQVEKSMLLELHRIEFEKSSKFLFIQSEIQWT